MHLQPPRASKKKALFALIQGSSCSCFDVERFMHPDTEPALQQCAWPAGWGTRVFMRVQVHMCAVGAERGEGRVHWECNAQGSGCPGQWVPTSAGARPCTGSSSTSVCVFLQPRVSPAPRRASSRCSGQRKPALGQLSMLGRRLLPLPKSGRSFPQDRVSQQYGDNGKMLRQHSWQPSARCSASAAAAHRSIVLEGREMPTSGRPQSQVRWEGREQEQDRLQNEDQNTARMGHR